MRGRQRRDFLMTAALTIAAPLTVRAQAPARVYRIGYLRRSDPIPEHFQAFRQALADLGYKDNVVIEQRYAHGIADRLATLAAELSRSNPHIVVVDGNTTALAAKRVFPSTLPIVFILATDPVSFGLVESLARPRTNFTGLTITAGVEGAGKRIEILKTAAPNLSRLAVLVNPSNATTATLLDSTAGAAGALGLQMRVVEATNAERLDGAFAELAKWGANGLATINDAMLWDRRSQIVDLAARNRLPAIYPEKEFAEAGGLIAYGPDLKYSFRRAAYYVDKILKGAKPADLPVEQPSKDDLVINPKAAKGLGLSVPQELRLRADTIMD